ncbi:MAG: Nramp family divalent metal transporter [Alphaproteobacteria bacterium]|nr:Nramp family divalent metal transporter [Alphaproteobacteria bacterium]
MPVAEDLMPSRSLPEVHRSIRVPTSLAFGRKFMAFAGPGYLVAVGYMDPGNWATDIAAGSSFGYHLLCVILLSNLMAVLLQTLCAKLGIVSGQDLAQICRARYSKPAALLLWFVCETAIVACDLAEVIGTAIALNLLFGIPLPYGVCLTVLDVFLILALQKRNFRWLEVFVIALISFIAGCFLYQISLAQPAWSAVAAGFLPHTDIITNKDMLYIATGIIGATVMPHNLYLHSALVQTRSFAETDAGRHEALRFARIDTVLALTFAFFVNAAILIVAASVFHAQGRQDVASIETAYELLTPMLGAGAASTVFALALLASGQNSAVTATLAGQIVMEGFLQIRLPFWARRLLTRLLAIIPAALVAAWYGVQGTAQLLVMSQVILSLQLPFAVIPLLRATADKKLMGAAFVNRWQTQFFAWAGALLIIALNVKMLFDLFSRL